MISYDFEYYKPKSIDEALTIFEELNSAQKKPIYYAGGTEIVTYARKNLIQTKAVIDIKEIKECTILSCNSDYIIFGAGVTLNEIIENNQFPLLSNVCKKIADHTVRNRLTLGGNICGRLSYREAILPFLVSDAEAVIATKEGVKAFPLSLVFDKRLKLNDGELLIQVKVKKEKTKELHYTNRKVKQDEIDYPLLHIVALKESNILHLAFSGVCAYPFSSQKVEACINDKKRSIDERIVECMSGFPGEIKNDLLASRDYRTMVLKKVLSNMLKALEGEEK